MQEDCLVSEVSPPAAVCFIHLSHVLYILTVVYLVIYVWSKGILGHACSHSIEATTHQPVAYPINHPGIDQYRYQAGDIQQWWHTLHSGARYKLKAGTATLITPNQLIAASCIIYKHIMTEIMGIHANIVYRVNYVRSNKRRISRTQLSYRIPPK